MKEDSIRESVELIDDEDLDLIAGGQGLNIGVSVDVNIAAIEQVIQQIQVFGSNAAAAAGAALSRRYRDQSVMGTTTTYIMI